MFLLPIATVTVHLLDLASVRIGTFNVNGKSPSQDLSTWIGGPLSIPVMGGEFSSVETYTDESEFIVALPIAVLT